MLQCSLFLHYVAIIELCPPSAVMRNFGGVGLYCYDSGKLSEEVSSNPSCNLKVFWLQFAMLLFPLSIFAKN